MGSLSSCKRPPALMRDKCFSFALLAVDILLASTTACLLLVSAAGGDGELFGSVVLELCSEWPIESS